MIKIVNSCSDKPVDVKVKIDKEAKVADLICSLQEITSLSIEGIEVAVGRSRTTVHLSAIKSDEILSTYVKSGDIVYVSKKEEVVLKRKIVPADNSCLFHSLQYLLQESRDLRSIVASEVLKDGTSWTEATLGKHPITYSDWIKKPQSWGGEIEMNILSRYFSVEIAAIDIQTRNFYIYGAGGGGDIKRIYLIYDGIHYDPMVYERKSGDLVTKFSPSDDSVMKQVQRVAQELFESRSFTDGATYTLRCMVCNEGIVGNDGAIAHGTKTGHTNFREY